MEPNKVIRNRHSRSSFFAHLMCSYLCFLGEEVEVFLVQGLHFSALEISLI